MDLGTSAALAVVVLLIAAPAYAYIDPGSGGMLVQLLTGGAAGALILARLYWRRFKDRLTPKSKATGAEGALPADTSGISPTDRP
jgi:Na+/proline symporter